MPTFSGGFSGSQLTRGFDALTDLARGIRRCADSQTLGLTRCIFGFADLIHAIADSAYLFCSFNQSILVVDSQARVADLRIGRFVESCLSLQSPSVFERSRRVRHRFILFCRYILGERLFIWKPVDVTLPEACLSPMPKFCIELFAASAPKHCGHVYTAQDFDVIADLRLAALAMAFKIVHCRISKQPLSCSSLVHLERHQLRCSSDVEQTHNLNPQSRFEAAAALCWARCSEDTARPHLWSP